MRVCLTASLRLYLRRRIAQTNPVSDSRKSPTLKSGLQTKIPALHYASWYQAEFPDHSYCSLMRSTSALLFLLFGIRRSWKSLPLPRLSCKTSLPASQPPKLFPEHRATGNMIDIFLNPVWKCLAHQGRLKIFSRVSRGAAPSTDIFSVRDLWPYPMHRKRRETSACSQIWPLPIRSLHSRA